MNPSPPAPAPTIGAILARLDGLLAEAGELRALLATYDPESQHRLSPQELRVFRLLRNSSLSQVEIAEHLGVTYNTVKSHARSVFDKTGSTRRHHLRQQPNW